MIDKIPPKWRRKRVLALIALAVIAAWGIGSRIVAAVELKHHTEDEAVASVVVMKAPRGPATEEIVLPGTVEAWHEATIYARTNGYVKDWYHGMGTVVHKGDLLATIETPELDAQLRQAEADLKTAEANNTLAQSTAERWKLLLATDSVSKQENDEKAGAAAAAAAAVASAKANRDHLKELSGFKHVLAPFDGIISSRTLDIGMLVNDGTFGNLQALFHVVQADRLRIYVQVPENDASAITPDLTAELTFTEHPGKSYTATLYKTAEAIDPTNRTMLIELVVENKDYELLSGGYTEAHLKLPARADNIRLPVNTLIFRAQGMQVATVDASNHVALKSITIGRDFGNEVEVTAGIEPDEQVVVNPPDSLVSGQTVKIVAPAETPAQKDDKKS